MMRSAPRPGELVEWLRAAGELSRLRLLALCAGGEFSVSDLALGLKQSEPRVSRHLKILCSVGLLERSRQGQWVHYRLASEPQAASFARGLLAQLDPADEMLRRDRERALHERSHRSAAAAGVESRLGRALQGFLASEPADPAAAARTGTLLLIGVEHLELLEGAAAIAEQCVALAQSRRAAQSARTYAEHRGLACRILTATRAGGASERELARAGTAFDALVLDHLAMSSAELPGMLAMAKRALHPGGRLWLFERYESLDDRRGRVVEHPLARLRRVLAEAGFVCTRLSPIEADGEHVLAAAGRAEAVSPHSRTASVA